MFALAFIVGGFLVYKRFEELGKPGDWAYESIFSALAGGLIGARLYWLIENYNSSDGFFSTLFSSARPDLVRRCDRRRPRGDPPGQVARLPEP